MSVDRILVIGANRYSFEDAGRLVKGITLHYLESYDSDDPNKRGIVPMKTPCTEEVFNALVQAPCYADAEFSRRPGKGGKAESFCKSVKVVKPFQLLGANG